MATADPPGGAPGSPSADGAVLAAEADVEPAASTAGARSVLLTVVPWDDPAVTALRTEQQAEITLRYDGVGGDLLQHLPAEQMLATVLLTVDGEPAGCGALRDAPDHGPRHGELKRFFVRPAHRGNGYGRLLLAELERLADDLGLVRLVLETGTLLTEAVTLYRSVGYREIPRYGPYVDQDDSLCFARWLRPELATRVLVLSGALGAGKTTVATAVGALLADRGVPHAVLDVDALCQVWPRPADDPYAQGLALEGLRGLAPGLAARGLRRVVLARVVERPEERADYERAFAGSDVTVVRLTARETVRRDRLAARGATGEDLAWELARTVELDALLAGAGADDAVVENAGRPATVVADEVLRAAGW